MTDAVKVWDEKGQEQDPDQADKWDTWDKCRQDKRFPKGLIEFLQHQSGCNFAAPTPIQAHSWPTLCAGKDLIGIAKTGSGKTLAFLLPGFMWLKKNKKSDNPVDCQVGPAILVMTPTRELCNQIYEDAAKFGKPVQITAACVYGGAGKQEQALRMKDGPETLIATPGRLNDFVQNGTVNMEMVRYCVLDEADRMLDMGFEPQIKEILDKVPAEGRQMAMFTATWNRDTRKIADSYINNPWHVQIGHDDMAANNDISQHIEIVKDDSSKKAALDKILGFLTEKGNCLVFCNSKKKVKDLAWELGDQAVELHGDLDQWRRDEALFKFRNGEAKVLVATDLASRGLDIRRVSIVVNYDAPKSAQDYVHRIGRTGRAGDAGDAFTFLSEWGQEKEALFIKQVMEQVGQAVPEDLSNMAGQAQDDNSWGKDDWEKKDDWGDKDDKKWDDWDKKDDWGKNEAWDKKGDLDKKESWDNKDGWDNKKDDKNWENSWDAKDEKKDSWDTKDEKKEGWDKKDDWEEKKDEKSWDSWGKTGESWNKEDKGWNEQEDAKGSETNEAEAATTQEGEKKTTVHSEDDMFDPLWEKLADGCSRIGEQILFDLVKQVHGSKGTGPDESWYSEEQFGMLCAQYQADPQEGLSKEQLLEVYRADHDKLFCLKEHFAVVVLEDAQAEVQVEPTKTTAAAAQDMEVDTVAGETAKRKAEDTPVPSSAHKLARKAPAAKAASEFAEVEQLLQEGKGDKLKAVQLREWLTFKGLASTGLKSALVERATTALANA